METARWLKFHQEGDTLAGPNQQKPQQQTKPQATPQPQSQEPGMTLREAVEAEVAKQTDKLVGALKPAIDYKDNYRKEILALAGFLVANPCVHPDTSMAGVARLAKQLHKEIEISSRDQ